MAGCLRHLARWLDRVFGAPTSDKAFGVSWSIALIYPVILMLIMWVVTDQNVSGITGFLPDDGTPIRQRATIIVGLITILLCFALIIVILKRYQSWCCKRPIGFSFALCIAIAITFHSVREYILVTGGTAATAGLLARKINDLSEKQLKGIQSLINKENKN